MKVSFFEYGVFITSVNMDYVPDNEDRLTINKQRYVVRDREFVIDKYNKEPTYAKLYLDRISK